MIRKVSFVYLCFIFITVFLIFTARVNQCIAYQNTQPLSVFLMGSCLTISEGVTCLVKLRNSFFRLFSGFLIEYK